MVWEAGATGLPRNPRRLSRLPLLPRVISSRGDFGTTTSAALPSTPNACC